MKPLRLVVLLLGLLPSLVMSAGDSLSYPNDAFSADHKDKSSLQRGARSFVNFCLGCHGASLSRFSRVARDLGIPDEIVLENLIDRRDTEGKKIAVGSLMSTSMTPAYGERAFGTPPPDLSLTSRSRGSKWIYNYLRGFYVDQSRPLGFNNGVFKDVGMPNVLWALQGTQKAIFEGEGSAAHIVGFEPLSEGSLNEQEYKKFAYDLTNFMDYLGEPYKEQRKSLGVWILIFLAGLGVLTYLLKREFWRDVK